MADVLLMQDYRIELDGTIIDKHGNHYNATPWAQEGKAPYSLEMGENWILAVDGNPFIPKWIRDLPMQDEEVGQMVMNAGDRSMLMVGVSAQSPAKRAMTNLHLAAKNAASINDQRSRR